MRKFVLPAMALAAFAASRAYALPQVCTVFQIAMENHNWTAPPVTGEPQQLLGNSAAPYINSLINNTLNAPGTSAPNPAYAQTSYASNYINAAQLDHPSEPNYVWSEAGTNYNTYNGGAPYLINNDNDPNAQNTFINAPHLTQQMNASGVAWKNYQEDYQITNSTTPTGGNVLVSKSGTSTTITNPYYGTNQYNYAAKHNPQAFFNDTANQNLNTFDNLRSDIAADTVTVSHPTATNNFGQYNWITPNQYNDMHSSLSTAFNYNGANYAAGTDQEAVAIGDHFLSVIIPQIMATQAYQNNGAIIIWMDESEPVTTTESAASRDGTDHTLMEIVISPLAKGNGFASTVELNHSSDVKTMEELFQLGGTLNNPITQSYAGTPGLNTVSGANDLRSLFVDGAIPSTVPEPASLALLALGGVALLCRRRTA